MVAIIPTASPPPKDAKLARDSSQKLASLAGTKSPLEIRVALDDRRPQKILLPHVAVRLLVQLLDEMSNGHAVTLLPHDARLTTQEAAQLLGVSRPFIIKEIKNKKIPFQKVGTHRRILFKHLVAYRQKCMETHDRATNELVREAQELGLGY